jgi:hypothetical protein
VKWIFENFTKLLGLLSFCLIAAATIHDWGYFYVVGSKFRSIQTTYDYITHAIEWMPQFLFIGGVAGYTGRALRAATTSHGDTGLSGQGIRRRYREQVIISVFNAVIVGVPSVLLSLTFPYPRNLIYFIGGLLILVASVCATFTMSPTRFILFLLAAFACVIFIVGISDGAVDSVGDIQPASNVYSLQLKGGSGESQALLLRSFEKGVLVRSPSDNRIEFIRWDQIEKLSHRVGVELEHSGCGWFHFFCREVVVP